MKIRIQDFQSIQDISLDIEGFTVIVGRSNIGKSAVVRALEGALTNKEGEDFVRTGSRYAEVDIQSPGLDLKWKKGSGYNDYVINGETLESVGRGAPPHIAEAGFKEIEINKSKINVQVASQFSPIFLLDPSKTSGSVAAELISDVGRLSEIQTALRECSRDKRSHESTVRVRRKDLQGVEEELKKYEEVEEDKALIWELRELKKEIEQDKVLLNKMSSLQEEYEKLLEVKSSLEGVVGVAIPSPQETKEVQTIEKLQTFWEIAQEQKEVKRGMQGVEEIEIKTLDLEPLVKKIQTLDRFYSHVLQANEEVGRYRGLRGVEVPERKGTEDLAELMKLQNLLLTLEKTSYTIPDSEKDIRVIEEEVEGIGKEIQSILEEAGACPLCGVSHD